MVEGCLGLLEGCPKSVVYTEFPHINCFSPLSLATLKAVLKSLTPLKSS